MATDGRRIWFNPAWCDKHGVDRIMGVTAHEVLHVVNKHHLRRGTRDPRLWNLAADLMINRVLEDDGYVLPPGLMFDREGRFAGLATETIYARLLEEVEQDPRNRPENGQGLPGWLRPAWRHACGQDRPPAGMTMARRRWRRRPPADIWGEVRDLTTEAGQPMTSAERVQADTTWMSASARPRRRPSARESSPPGWAR